MALNINGTTGISGVNGSASAPALQGVDSNTGVSFGTDIVNVVTGGTTRATVDSSGNFGIGTTSPQSLLNLAAASGSAELRLTRNNASANGNTYGNIKYTSETGVDVARIRAIRHSAANDAALVFETAASGTLSERMRVTSGGALCVGTTAPTVSDVVFHAQNNTGNVGMFYADSTTDNYPLIVRNNRCDGGTTGTLIYFQKSGGGEIGSIRANGSATSYNTTSDYRLKENVTDILDGITRLKTLKPYRFNFKDTPSITVDGFFAHEVTAVPEAITGTKDEVDSDNNPVYQGIDQSKLVPLLTAALQEAIAKIEVLETKVAALEAG